jgi:hypothetical protein
LNYSELDDSDQQAIFYMLIDCVSYILNFQKCNRCGAVAKVRFEIPSCQKMSSRTVGPPNFQRQRTKFRYLCVPLRSHQLHVTLNNISESQASYFLTRKILKYYKYYLSMSVYSFICSFN